MKTEYKELIEDEETLKIIYNAAMDDWSAWDMTMKLLKEMRQVKHQQQNHK